MTGTLDTEFDYRYRTGGTKPRIEKTEPARPSTTAVDVPETVELPGLTSAQVSAADLAERRFREEKAAARTGPAMPSARIMGALCLVGAAVVLLMMFLQSGPQVVPPAQNRMEGISPANIFSDAAVQPSIRPLDMLTASSAAAAPSRKAPESAAGAAAAPLAATLQPSPAPQRAAESAYVAPVRRERRAAEMEEHGDEENGGGRERRRASGGSVVLFEEGDEDVSVIVPAAEAPAPVVVNVGERLVGKFLYPIITGGGAVPATLTVVEDLVVGGQLAVPAGARLVGQAFATTTNDRVQILISAVVIDGRTVPMTAVAFDEDNQLGVAGKLIKKGGGLKGVGGKVAGIFSKAVVFGAGQLVPGGSLLGTAASGAVTEGSSTIDAAAAQWTLSSKIIQIAADKRVVVFLSSDLHPKGGPAADMQMPDVSGGLR